MGKLILKSVFSLVVLLLVPAGSLSAQERITDFNSRVVVDQDGMLTVTETITVFAEGKQIKRGIYRDFPTDYTDKTGQRISAGFGLLSVRKDERHEPYNIEQRGNGVRIYIGSQDLFLEPGLYTYTITYQTDGWIGFFQDYDELYWNVTGHDWAFPIEKASATIVLPEGAGIIQYNTYTGRTGSKNSHAEVVEKLENTISFRTAMPLVPGEGFTFAVAWPKGIVEKPSTR